MAAISALAALLGPLLGLAVRASRRNRMVGRIRTLNTLANDVAPNDPASAAVLRELVSKRVERLAALEHASLARRFDPAAPFAFVFFFILPAGIASYFAWTRSGWWTWP